MRARLGQTYYVYEKVSVNARNEALDLHVYNTAARVKLNPVYDAIARRRLQHLEVADNPPAEPSEDGTQHQPEPPKTTPEGRRRGFKVINNQLEGYKP
jgi:phage terminase large subunit GpA-like protein